MTESLSSTPLIERPNNQEVFDSLYKSIEVTPNDKSINKFSEAINRGDIPLVVSNHLSLVDVVGMIKIVELINPKITNENFKGFYLPYDIYDPAQDTDIVKNTLLPIIKEKCEKINIFLLPIVIGDAHQEELTPELEDTIDDSFKKLGRLSRPDGHGLIIFPEGETTGGTLDSSGSLIGLHPNKKGTMVDSLIKNYDRKSISFTVLPVAVSNTNQILNHDGSTFNPSALAEAKILNPILNSDFASLNPQENPTNLINKKIATSLNSDFAGYYKTK